MREWTDAVRMMIDVLLGCVIIAALLSCFYLSSSIMRTVDNTRATTADVQEYRVALMYDNQQCRAPDIVSLVLEYQGNPRVVVTTRAGTTYTWSSGSYATALTTAAISAPLNQSSVYLCTVTYDANGDIYSYGFKEV